MCVCVCVTFFWSLLDRRPMDEEQKYTRLCSQVRTQRGSVKLTVAMQRIWGRGGAQKKRPLFSYVWLQEVHLKLQPVRWARKCVTRPVESWCLIDEELSSLDESLVAICRKTLPSSGLSSARLQKVRFKLQPVRWARKCVTRPVVSGLIFRGWPSSLFVPVVAIFSVGRGGRP